MTLFGQGKVQNDRKGRRNITQYVLNQAVCCRNQVQSNVDNDYSDQSQREIQELLQTTME